MSREYLSDPLIVALRGLLHQQLELVTLTGLPLHVQQLRHVGQDLR